MLFFSAFFSFIARFGRLSISSVAKASFFI